MIAILDYDAGNIRSVEKAVKFLGKDACITRDKNEIFKASHVILPGVGSFGDAMEHLNAYGLTPIIKKLTDEKIPFLGICLGLQVIFESSEESPGVEGLSLIPGKIIRIPDGEGLKIPHIGWNSLHFQNDGRLFKGIDEGAFTYFVHSYYLKANDENVVKATTEYGVTIHASVEKNNIFACQFHPEKSGEIGLRILNNFLSI